ncbi:putative membrane protein [Arthrobacter sp. CAN_A6]
MDNLDADLRSTDRAAAAPFTQTPRISAWYPFAMATYFTVVAVTFPLMRDGKIILGIGLLLVAVTAVLILTLTIRARWGTWPRLSVAPPEIKRAFTLFTILAMAALIVSGAIWLSFGDIAGLIAVFLTALAIVWAYEFRLYPVAAQQVRQRLA